MTTEHVSVPRGELDDLLNTWEKEFSVLRGMRDNFISQGEAFATKMHIKELKAILYRTTTSPHEVIRQMESELPADIYGREPSVPRVVTDAPLGGRWHHGNGCLVCGSFRVAKADWEAGVCTADNLRERVFDWICATLNGEPSLPAVRVPNEEWLEKIVYEASASYGSSGPEWLNKNQYIARKLHEAMIAAAPNPNDAKGQSHD